MEKGDTEAHAGNKGVPAKLQHCQHQVNATLHASAAHYLPQYLPFELFGKSINLSGGHSKTDHSWWCLDALDHIQFFVISLIQHL